MESVIANPILDRRPGTEAPPLPPPATALPPLRVADGFFRDPDGRTVLLHGLNYSHRTKSRPSTAWQRAEHFAQIRRWGFNVVRYVVIWEDVEPEPGAYDAAYLADVERAVRWARDQGLYVIVDFHQDLFARIYGGDGAPVWACRYRHVLARDKRTPWYVNYFLTHKVQASFDAFFASERLQEHYAGAWAAVVARVKDYGNVLGYDPMNEPFCGSSFIWTFEAQRLSALYRKVASRIRALDPARPLFVEPTPVVGNNGLPSLIRRPDPNVVYAPHYYDPIVTGGIGYVPGLQKILPWTGLLTHKRVARRLGTAAFLGEFGVNLEVPGAYAALRDQLELLERNLFAGWAYWDYNPDLATNETIEVNHESVVDERGRERPSLDLLIRPYPRALVGTPTRMRFDAARRRYALAWRGAAGTSEIRLPRRRYPQPPRIELSDGTWTYDAEGELLRVTVSHPGEHRLQVTP